MQVPGTLESTEREEAAFHSPGSPEAERGTAALPVSSVFDLAAEAFCPGTMGWFYALGQG